ncbi:MAG: VPLPA-CTERM sorting domain-containing protein [Gammaproteobacteria bacterium]|jgi:hypothetical protein
MPRTYLRSLLGAATLLLAGNPALASDVLFDPALGTPPSEQGLFFCSGGASALCVGLDGTQSPVPEGVELDSTTSGNTGQVGFSNSLPPLILPPAPLDRTAGFTLNFDLRVGFEEHESNDRAGFSVIVLSSDSRGIELGFWEQEVWAQNWVMDDDEFTHGEGVAFDTTKALVTYSLGILGNSYTLSVAGSPLLDGVLRDYSAEGVPYDVANFVFFGDDTTRARAIVTLGKIAVVPLPASLMLLLPAIGALLVQRRTRDATQVAIT